MPRPLRINVPNLIFHVLNRGNNKQTVFLEEQDFRVYLEIVKKYKEKFGIKIYHYCLMPNHEHFLLEPTKESALSKFMQGITQVNTQFSHKKYGSVGHVWQSRYKSSLVEEGDYKIQCAYYIENNPRRAKLIEKLEDWPWSSYHLYAYGKVDPIVDVDSEYLNLGFAQGIFGSTDFIEKMKEKFKIELIGKRGRPRKGA